MLNDSFILILVYYKKYIVYNINMNYHNKIIISKSNKINNHNINIDSNIISHLIKINTNDKIKILIKNNNNNIIYFIKIKNKDNKYYSSGIINNNECIIKIE
jgi:hypothetical protein